MKLSRGSRGIMACAPVRPRPRWPKHHLRARDNSIINTFMGKALLYVFSGGRYWT